VGLFSYRPRRAGAYWYKPGLLLPILQACTRYFVSGGRKVTWKSLHAPFFSFLIGDPDSITEQILHQREVTGAGVVAIRLELGDVNLDEVTDNLELFAREVLPVLRKA